jgi:hypothetical protein
MYLDSMQHVQNLKKKQQQIAKSDEKINKASNKHSVIAPIRILTILPYLF